MRTGVALLAGLAVAACCLGQSDEGVQIFPVGEGAYALYPPELVAEGQVWEFASSRDGRYVAVVRSARQTPPIIGDPPQPKNFELLVYDFTTSKSTVRPLPRQTVLRDMKLEWAGGGVLFVTASLLYSVAERPGSRFPVSERALIVYKPLTGNMVTAMQNRSNAANRWRAHICPTEPIAVVVWQERTVVGPGEVDVSQQLATVGADGRLVNRKRIDPLTSIDRDRRWSIDGKKFVSTASVVNMEERKIERGFLHYDPGTGAIEFKTQAEPTWAPRPVDGLGIAIEPNLIERGGHTYQFNTTWVRSDSLPGGFVTEHAGTAKLAPNASHVAYLAEGALFARDLKKLSEREYAQYLHDLAMSIAINDAKQVALSLLMYAADYDDVISPELNFPNDLFPYMGSKNSADNFVYIFEGGLLTEVKDVARTPYGYIDTPYGRATAYLDGHVEWEEK